MSDTPRTDVVWAKHQGTTAEFFAAVIDHARQLERELAEVRKLLADESRDATAIAENLFKVTEQRDALAEALRSIDPGPDYEITDDMHDGGVFCELSVTDIRIIRAALQNVP